MKIKINKAIKATIVFILAILTLLTGFCIANKSVIAESGITISKNDGLEERTNNDPNHYYLIKETKDYIIRRGETDYVAVIPDELTSGESKGVSLFREVFLESTGIDIVVKRESEVENYSETSRYISFGHTKLVGQSGIDTRLNELKDQGIRIVTKGLSIFILSNGNDGFYNSVMELLRQLLNYEYFYTNIYSLDKNVIDLKFYTFDVFDNPDIGFVTSMYHLGGNIELTDNLKIKKSYTEYFISSIPMAHNSFYILNPKKHLLSHPKWYSEDRLQLCYTAHGDKDEYREMLKTSAEFLAEQVIQNPQAKAVSFTHEDGYGMCQCTSCWNDSQNYNTEAAPVIHFMNDLRPVLTQKLQTVGVTRNIDLVFFAYDTTKKAPVKRDTEGNIVPVDNSVVCKEGVIPMLTPVHANLCRAIDDPVNEEYYAMFKEWSVISQRFTAYLYSERCTMVESYMMPYGNFSSLQSWNKELAKMGTDFLFYEADASQQNPSRLASYKIYLIAQLAWNANANVEKLKNKWFDNVFLDASPYMKQYFEDLNLRMNYNYDVLNMYGICFSGPNLLTEQYWPKNTIQQWLELFEKAHSAVSKYKDSAPELYKTIDDMITLESLSPRFLYISIHADTLSTSDLRDMKQAFYDDATRLKTRKDSMAWSSWGN